MPIFLAEVESGLRVRLALIEAAFIRLEASKLSYRTIDRFALQEGLISALWQSWGKFCRDVLVQSASGARVASGAITNSPYSTNTEAEIAYVARQLAQNANIGNIKALVGAHQEPTWGDLTKINSIVSGLGSSNQATLLSAFGAAQFLSDLQLCRNASAHYCADRIADVRAARVRYNSTAFRHPSDMLRWLDPQTQDPLWRHWIGEIRVVAAGAVA